MHDRLDRAARSARELPPPDAEASAHSARLAALIRTEIERAGGRIDFARYMQLALYAPGLGYYAAGARKFGAAGDFVTAPEIAPLFSQCLARQCAEVLTALGGGDILEFGAGSGVMAADILQALAALDSLPQRYLILELSADLRQRQQQLLRERLPQLIDRVQWLDALPDGLRGVVLANEVLDAMPVQRFRIEQDGLAECYVIADEHGLGWQSGPPGDARLKEALGALAGQLPLGYESEVNLNLGPWLASLSAALAQGVVLLIDYGFPRHEYYHPQRSEGTLMCHYRHRAHGDALILPGLQDITAHVDFTAVAEAAVEAGLEVAGFTHQAAFLLALGVTELAAEPADTRTQLQRAAQVKRLTLPSEMGELFKVMALGKAFDYPLRGFALLDQRARL